MPWTTHLLVVASRTADSDDLVSYLRERTAAGPLRTTLVVPVESAGPELARTRMERGVRRLSDAGIDVNGTVAGDGDVLHAVLDVYDRTRHDEIIIVTLPEHLSRWLGCDLPQRVGQVTGALVHHVETRAARAARAAAADRPVAAQRAGPPWSWFGRTSSASRV